MLALGLTFLIAATAAVTLTVALGPAVALAVLVLPALVLSAAWAIGPAFGRRPAATLDSLTGHQLLAAEMARSRRYGRSFVLVRVRPADGASPVEMGQLAACVRGTDHAWLENDDLYVIMPEATRDDAGRLRERMRKVLGSRFVGAIFRAAAFPVDALTAGALVSLVSADDITRSIGAASEVAELDRGMLT